MTEVEELSPAFKGPKRIYLLLSGNWIIKDHACNMNKDTCILFRTYLRSRELAVCRLLTRRHDSAKALLKSCCMTPSLKQVLWPEIV